MPEEASKTLGFLDQVSMECQKQTNIGLTREIGGVGKTATVHHLLSHLPSTLILALSGLLALNEGGKSKFAHVGVYFVERSDITTALHGFLWLTPDKEINASNFTALVQHGIKALRSRKHSYHQMFTGADRATIVLAEISQWSRWQFELLEAVIRGVSMRPNTRQVPVPSCDFLPAYTSTCADGEDTSLLCREIFFNIHRYMWRVNWFLRIANSILGHARVQGCLCYKLHLLSHFWKVVGRGR